MKILTVPQDTKILRTKSRPVDKIDAELLAFLTELGETLKSQKDPAGVGLSAIQVGKPIRAFATFLPPAKSEVRGQRSDFTSIRKGFPPARLIREEYHCHHNCHQGFCR